MKRICVYCGAQTGFNSLYKDVATELGTLMAQKGYNLVYGGGKVGLMGAVADAVLAHGGHATGIIPQKLVDKEQAHRGIQDLQIVSDMHQRKATMANLADAFIALPGGFGTLEELFEVLTWSQIGYHAKPIAIINTGNFYSPLINFVDHAVQEGFIQAAVRKYMIVTNSPQEALEQIYLVKS